MNSRINRFVAIGVTFMLFGAVDLVALLLTPGPQRGWVLVPPVVAAITSLIVLPYILSIFQRQEEHISIQKREIDTLHAMDTAIVSERELDRVLHTAVRKSMGALDAVAGGVVLLAPAAAKDTQKDPDTSQPVYQNVTTETMYTPDNSGEEAERFRAFVRSGGRPERLWETVIAPFEVSEGEKGYLAVGRFRPCKPFDDGERPLLEALASTVGVAVSNARSLQAARRAARAQEEAEKVFADLERERRVAQALTEGLLPDVPARIGNWGLSRRYVPQSDEAQVGGDIYDLFLLGPGRLAVVIADVSGKGLAAARKTAMVKYSLRSYAREHDSPGRVLEKLNDAMTDEPDMTGFVTLFYGILDDASGALLYASAGHEPPLLRRATGEFETLSPTGMVLGAMRDLPYEDETILLQPGDGFLLYTDGLTEARAAGGKTEFLELSGVEALLQELEAGTTPPEELADRLLERLRRYTGDRRFDDTALVWVQRMGAANGIAA